MPVYLAKRKILKYRPSSGLVLPQAGPFAGFAAINVGSLPNFVTSGNANVSNNTASAPLEYNSLTINHTLSVNPINNYCIVIWANVVTFGASGKLLATGVNGGAASIVHIGPGDDEGKGGDGGAGCGGGGGGAATDGIVTSGRPIPGGDGGTGNNSGPATNQGSSIPGAIGIGTGNVYIGAYGAFPMGGEGGQSLDGYSFQGSGIFGGGGGGSGSGFADDEGILAGGGGGGGGGLVAVICNTLIVTAGASLISNGGDGHIDLSSAYAGGGGGGGSLYIAARTKTGSFSTVSVDPGFDFGGIATAGDSAFYQINTNNSLTLRSNGANW